MADIITSGAAVIAPTIILGYESSRETRTVVHPILGRPAPDATLRPAGLRTGRLELGFTAATAEADSAAAETILSAAATFTLVSADRTTAQMAFVLPEGGRLSRALDDSTRNAWVVSFDWTEITP